jgi:hypothetical protein
VWQLFLFHPPRVSPASERCGAEELHSCAAHSAKLVAPTNGNKLMKNYKKNIELFEVSLPETFLTSRLGATATL